MFGHRIIRKRSSWNTRNRRKPLVRSVFFETLESRKLLAALRMVSWNTLNNPDTALEDADFSTIFGGIGNELVAGTQQAVDILALQETDFAGSSGSIGRIESILDALYPTTDYQHVVTTLDGGGDATGFVYNTNTVNLLESVTVSGSLTHRIMRAKFRPTGVSTMDFDFYAYSIHLKAGTDPGDATKRASEATILRNDADALGQGSNVIFMGDFNLQSSFETAWTNLTASGNAEMFDPINRLGSWHNNNNFKDTHTQNPQNDPQGGYMDDRFDFQLHSNEFTDGGGIEYIAGSYRAYGNNGTHNLNGPITSGSGASPTILNALASASDHLPVVVDYDIGTLTPGIRITETDGGTLVEEGGNTDTYQIVLNTPPTSNVTVTLDVDGQLDVGGGGGADVYLTFTPANALTPQTVTVAAVDDLIPESQQMSTIVHSTSSTDPTYDMLAGLDDVVVTITDNDTSIVISEIMYNPLSDEAAPGRGEWIEIVNNGNGSVDISGWQLDDEDNGPDQDWGPIPNGTTLAVNQVAVLFDSAFTNETDFRNEWAVPTSAKVIGITWGELNNNPSATNEVLELKDDLGTQIDLVNFDDGTPWPTDNPSGPSIYLENLAFNNNFGQNWSRSSFGVEGGRFALGPTFDVGDIGSPGVAPGITGPSVTLSVDDVQVSENAGTLTFTITADQAPASDVMVDYSTADVTAAAGSDYTAVSGSATIAALTTSTTVVVNIADDQVDELIETFELNLYNASVGALIGDPLGIGSITDNDVAGVTIVESGGTTDVTEGSVTDDFTLVLDTVPVADVTITLTPDAELDLGAGAGVAVNRVFTTANALTAQPITVTAVDDAVGEGPHIGSITIAVASADTFYDGMAISDLTANITDNDPFVSLFLEGEVVDYTAPGTYTFEYFATANGGNQVLQAFQFPIAFDVAGVTFSGNPADFTPNPAFLLEAVVPQSTPYFADYILAGTSLTTGLTLVDGVQTSLFTIDLNVAPSNGLLSGLNEVGTVIDSGVDAINFELVDPGINLITNYALGQGLTLQTDGIAPTVSDLKVAGSGWDGGFVTAVDPADGLGLSLPGANQLRNLPYTNLNQIFIEFSEDVGTFTASDVVVTGVNTPLYSPTVSYNSSTFVATLDFAIPLSADKIKISISDALTDVAGNQLDGEWTDGTSTVSGNGSAGGNFDFRIDVVPGDYVDSNDSVTISDILAINALVGSIDFYADINGSNAITISDVLAANALVGTSALPAGAPTLVLAAPVATLAQSERGDDERSWDYLVDTVFDELGKSQLTHF